VKNSIQAVEQLKDFVQSKTGMPKVMTKFLFQNKLIQMDHDIASLPSEANIHLKVDLVGGQNCELCFTTATMYCSECKQYFCTECCDRFHSHPRRNNHSPTATDTSQYSTESLSQASSATDDGKFCCHSDISFQDAMLISTLAERFGITSFKSFQKKIIDATLEGRDTLVIHPTGSGKSLYFQFPPVFQDKKAFVITPTISLIQDQVHGLQQLIPHFWALHSQTNKQNVMLLIHRVISQSYLLHLSGLPNLTT